MGGQIEYLPVVKISKQMRKIIDATHDWEDKGFSRDVAAAAATICLYVDKLERRIARLEKRNSKQRLLSRMRSDKLSHRKLQSATGGKNV